MKYIKQDLINEVAKANKITKIEASKNIEQVLDGLVSIVRKMEPDDTFILVGYLNILMKELGERNGTHPKTHAPIVKPKSKVVRIRPGSEFLEGLN